MAPVVHGLEQQYKDRLDFLYLNIAEGRNRPAMQKYGFVSTPHFFFVRSDGIAVESIRGVVPADSITGAIGRLLRGSAKR